MKNLIPCYLLCGLGTLLAACDQRLPHDPDADSNGHTAPTEATITANQAVLDSLNFSDEQDFQDAARGLIASDPSLRIASAAGSPVWDLPANAFISEAV